MDTTLRAYTVLGTTDEVTATACDCCGRSDLKSTVALEDEHGAVVYFGCVCAAKAMRIPAKDVRKAARTADEVKAAAALAEQNRLHRIESDRWRGWLATLPNVVRNTWGQSIGEVAIFETMEANGGFKAVTTAYRAWVAAQA